MPKPLPHPVAPAPPDARCIDPIRPIARTEQAQAWQRAFGRPMPRLHRTLAAECLLYEQQVQATRGLSRDAERALSSLLPSSASGTRPIAPRRFKPGTRLLRTWQGRTYTVTVADPGFLFDGRTYRSLSVIAREITGTPWSGPAFFGLPKRRTAARGPT